MPEHAMQCVATRAPQKHGREAEPPTLKPEAGMRAASAWEPFAVIGGLIYWRRAVATIVKTARGKPAKDVGVPAWAVKAAKKAPGVEAAQLFRAIAKCIELIAGDVDPARCATAAKPVVALWVALEHAPLQAFVNDIGAVAEWARESDDPLASRDIRGEGWADSVDRSRHVSTLCVQKKWADRLASARNKGPRDTGTLPSSRGDAMTADAREVARRMRGGGMKDDR